MSSPCPLPIVSPPPITGDGTPNPEATAVPVGELVEPVPGEVVEAFYPCLPDTSTAPANGGGALLLVALAIALVGGRLWGRGIR